MNSSRRTLRSSQVIVEPQELQEFLRSAKDITKLDLDLGCSEKNYTLSAADSQNNKISPKRIEIVKNKKTGIKRFFGLFFSLAAGTCLLLAFLIVRKFKDKYHPVWLSVWRYVWFPILMPPYMILMKCWKGVNVFDTFVEEIRKRKWILIPYSLMMVAGVSVFVIRFYALKYISVGDMTVIGFSGSIFTVIFGHFFLKERCGIVTIPISLFTLLGVVVIARPPLITGEAKLSSEVMLGTWIAFSSTLIQSIYYVAMRKFRTIHFSVVMFSSGLVGIFVCAIVSWILDVIVIPNELEDWLLIGGMGLLSLLGSVSLIAALKFEEAGTVGIFRMSDVILSFLYQFIFFGTVPDLYSIIGAVIVTTGVLLITLRKILSTLPQEHLLRRACCILLK